MPKPNVFILFCEDNREEKGNKNSFMGVFGPDLYFDPTEEVEYQKTNIVGLVRLFEPGPVDAKMVIQFFSPDPEYKLPDKVENTITIPPQAASSECTVNIVCRMPPIPMIDGVRIDVSLEVLDCTANASFSFHEGIEDEALPSN